MVTTDQASSGHRLRLLNVNCCQKMTIVDHREPRSGPSLIYCRGGVTYREQKQTKVHEYDILQRSKFRIESETVLEDIIRNILPTRLARGREAHSVQNTKQISRVV